MPQRFRGIRLATVLIVVAVCAVTLGLGVQIYRAWSPVRRWIRESRPGNSQFKRLQAVMNLSYEVPRSEREEAFPVLLAAAKDPDPLVRGAAVVALRDRRDHFAEVLAIFRGLMKDPDPRVREAAIFHLETFVKRGSPEMSTLLPDLIAALDDPKPAVRLEACRALYVYGQLPRAVPALARLAREEEGTLRQGAVGFLLAGKAIPRDLEPTLRTLLKSEYVWERIWAGEALIRLGVPDRERDAIIKTMLEGPRSAERLAAARFLIQLGKPEGAIPTLQDVAARGDREDRITAADLLIQLGEPELATPALKEMAAGGDRGLRERAERLLAPLRGGEEGP
jgi:HEAT repeat protein